MARSFRSAASRCASADFTPFPLSAFGAMAEVVGKVVGVVTLVAMRGGALLSRLREEGGERRRFLGLEQQTAKWGNCPCFPCL